MKKTESKLVWYFVDEAGDPTFYNRRGNVIVGAENGSSKLLMLGFLETENPRAIREALESVRQEIASDPYLQGIPSMQKTLRSFHAKDDVAEVRERVFKKLATLDFKTQFIVVRKRESIFRSKFKGKEMLFYDHFVTQLFTNVLHRASHNRVYFSQRSSRSRQEPLKHAIKLAISKFEEKWNTTVESKTGVMSQTPSGEPCLQAIDYMCWSVYRAYTTGDMRFYQTVEDKVSLISDPYDTAKYPKNYYSKSKGNPFDIKKVSPL